VPLRGGRFIAATAFTSTCLQSLDVTIELARHLAARVDCVHVIRLPVQPLRFAAADWPRIVPDETREELLHTHARDLGAFLGEARGSGCTPYTVIDASVARGLRDQAIETAADLITIPTHSGGREHPPRFGSTTENVIKLAPVPVLVFPVPFLERRWSVAAE